MAAVRVLYVGGLGRSGTTLLERILGELPQTVALGEVVHLWQRDLRDGERCACGDPFLECEFWTRVGKAAFGGWAEVDVDRVLALGRAVDRTRFIPRLAASPLADRHLAPLIEYTDHYQRIYAAAAAETGARLVVDSSKHASLAYCLSYHPDVDLRVLHVVRDSRGVAYSWTKIVDRPETGGRDTMAAWSPGKTAVYWNAHNIAFTAMPALRRRVRVLRVRYESFIADPVATIASVADFAGLELTGSDLPFLSRDTVDLTPGHSAAGNPMRFTSGRLAVRRDEAWRAELPQSQRRLVTALTAPGLFAYGYPLSAR